jgi:hypothetical protein
VALSVSALAQSRASAQASTATTYNIGIMGGLAVPTGDLSNFTSSGYNLGVTLGMHQPLTPLSFRVEGSFTELPISGGTSSDKHRIYGIALDGLYNLGQPSTNGGLYLTGGVGYYGSREVFADPFGGTTQTTTDWNFGLNGGLGYYLPLSGFTMNFEARYQYVFSNNPAQALFPITVGITF